MYSDVFCRVYNEFGWNYYPEAFGQQLLSWLETHPAEPKTCLDLACGTGILCRILWENGFSVRGMDLSEGMIRIARESCPEIPFDVADMTLYRPEARFSLVTCTGDALNHIPELSELKKIFRNVFDCLNPGGWFVFDILNEREVSDSEPFEMDFDDQTRVWFQMTRPGENRVHLTIRVWEQQQPVLEEVIRETIHDVREICALLAEQGFRNIRLADSLLEEGGHGTTWFVTAQK